MKTAHLFIKAFDRESSPLADFREESARWLREHQPGGKRWVYREIAEALGMLGNAHPEQDAQAVVRRQHKKRGRREA